MKGPSFTCSVKTQFLPEQSQLPDGPFAFAYTVTVRNTGGVGAQLVARHWVITDATGHVEEVRGEGVIGKQPKLEPGETFEYSSWAMLGTSFGSMRGEYAFERSNGSRFDAVIGEFALTEPHALH